LWAEVTSGNYGCLALQDEVALGVAHAIKLELSPGAAGPARFSEPVNTEAYEAYLKGSSSRKSATILSPRKRLFSTGHSIGSRLPRPPTLLCRNFYALSDALPPAEALPKAREYAQEALRIDPDLPASHVSLAYVLFYHDGPGPAADKSSDARCSSLRGLPSHRWYSIYLAAMGQPAEAMTEAQRAADLDPLSVSAHDSVAIAAACSGQYDRNRCGRTHDFRLGSQ